MARIRRSQFNALLSKPPHQFHYLTRPTTYDGRPITAEDYEGVHTTTKFDQAAAYASGTVEKCRCGYPVVLELDVSGLSALPDIDAMLTAENGLFDNHTRTFIQELVTEETSIHEVIQAVADHLSFSDGDGRASVGDHWNAYVFEDFQLANAPQAFLDAYKDDDKAWEALVKYAGGGNVDPAVLANLTSQRRWLADFDQKRVLRVYAFKPLWDTILDSWWELDDDKLTAEAEAIEAAGYDIVTLDTIGNGLDAVQTKQVIWERSKKVGSGEFHGTSSEYAKAAFPRLPIPIEPPFPVTEPDFDADDDDEEEE